MSGQDSVGLQTRICYDLSGGMVTNWNFAKVNINQYKLLLNGDLTKDGAIERRKGKIKLLTTALTNHPTIISLSTLGQDQNADLILAAGGGGVFEVSTGVAGLNLRSGISSTAYLAYTTLINYNFYVNGVDVPFMTNGTLANTYQVGINAASSNVGFLVAAIAGGDGTDGSHRLAYRYRSTITGARSNPYILSNSIQGVSVTLGAGNNTYQITFPIGLISSDTQVDVIDYFVQEAGANVDAPYYFLGSSANAVGVYTFGTNVSDEELIVNESLDIDDNTPPTSLRAICTWRDRLLAIKDDYRVAYSKQRVDANGIVSLPTSWPPDNELSVGYGDGDPLVTVINFNDYILAFKRRSIWILTGDFDSPNFGFKRLKANFTNVGLLNQRAIVQAGERIFFVTDDLKFYWFSITDFSTTELRLKDPPPSEPVGDIFRQFASNYRDFVNLVNFNFAQFTQIWIAFSNGSSGQFANQNFNTFVFDWTANDGRGAWHIHTGFDIASSVLARDSDRNYSIYTGDYFGNVWKHNQTNGDGAEINGTSTGGNYNEITISGQVGPGFLVGETITGVSSGSSGTITFVGIGFIRVNATNGGFVIGEQITNINTIPPPGVTTTAFVDDIFGILNDTNITTLFTSDLTGVLCTIIGGTGIDQIRRIEAVNSISQLQLLGGWDIVPDNTSIYSLGSIDFNLVSRDDWCDDGVSLLYDKLGWYLDLDIELSANANIDPKAVVSVDFFIDRGQDAKPAVLRNLNNSGSYWGFAYWGFNVWLGTAKSFGQVGFNLYFKQISHQLRNRYAGYYVRVNGWVYTFQTLGQIRTL